MVNQQELKRIFPQTLKSLREQKLDSVLTDFSRFCTNDLTHTSDAKGWLPVFLKAQGLSVEVAEICHFEWLQFCCVSQDWGMPKLDQGQIGVLPGLQFINLDKSAKSLSHPPGPVVIYSDNGKAKSRPLAAAEALLLDVLSEDRKFTQKQLIEFLQMEGKEIPSLQKTDWETLITKLLEEKLLITK